VRRNLIHPRTCEISLQTGSKNHRLGLYEVVRTNFSADFWVWPCTDQRHPAGHHGWPNSLRRSTEKLCSEWRCSSLYDDDAMTSQPVVDLAQHWTTTTFCVQQSRDLLHRGEGRDNVQDYCGPWTNLNSVQSSTVYTQHGVHSRGQQTLQSSIVFYLPEQKLDTLVNVSGNMAGCRAHQAGRPL